MSVTHSYVSTAPPVSDKVDSVAWNAEHVITFSEATIDFGTKPVYNKSFAVTDANVTASSKIMLCGSAVVDEGEFDAITYTAKAGSGSFTVYANAQPGPVSGTRVIYYLIGA